MELLRVVAKLNVLEVTLVLTSLDEDSHIPVAGAHTETNKLDKLMGIILMGSCSRTR